MTVREAFAAYQAVKAEFDRQDALTKGLQADVESATLHLCALSVRVAEAKEAVLEALGAEGGAEGQA